MQVNEDESYVLFHLAGQGDIKLPLQEAWDLMRAGKLNGLVESIAGDDTTHEEDGKSRINGYADPVGGWVNWRNWPTD